MSNKSLTLETIMKDLIFILNEYYPIMDTHNQTTLNGLNEATKTLDYDHENYDVDVKYYLNTVIDLCTGFEDQMSEQNQDEINEFMLMIKDIDLIDDFYLGQFVIYEDFPYKIYDMDYDDFSIFIGDDIDAFWVRPRDLKTKC